MTFAGEEWRKRTGRSMTAEQREWAVKRYPGTCRLCERFAHNARAEGRGHVTKSIRGLGRHARTIGQALVVVIGVLLLMEFLGVFLPALANTLVLVAGSLLALGVLFGARVPR